MPRIRARVQLKVACAVALLGPVFVPRLAFALKADSPTPVRGSASITCRTYDPEGDTSSECPGWPAAVDSTALKRVRRHSLTSSPLSSLKPQAFLDTTLNSTAWQLSNKELPAESLGSHSRYASCIHYWGDCNDLLHAAIPAEEKAVPHSKQFTSRTGNFDACSHEYELVSKSDTTYTWATQENARTCLQGRWIALFGDSTHRLFFSALLHFLGADFESSSLPTHDFSYKRHFRDHDHCSDDTCHIAAYFPDANIVVTFDFAMRVHEFDPSEKVFGRYRNKDVFPDLPDLPSAPDVFIMNNGPWQYYIKGKNHTLWVGDHAYSQTLSNFLAGVLKNVPSVFLLENLVCHLRPKHIRPGEGCFGSGTNITCEAAMAHVSELQYGIVQRFIEAGHSIRYLWGSALTNPLPDDYKCDYVQNSYHLPSIVTDARLNHALYAMCGGS